MWKHLAQGLAQRALREWQQLLSGITVLPSSRLAFSVGTELNT